MNDSAHQQSLEKIAAIRARFNFQTEQIFIEKYAPNITKTGIFIKTPKPRPVGTRVRFEFHLADGTPVLRGVGEVAWQSDRQQNRPPGMGVKFLKLDKKSKAVVDRVIQYKAGSTAAGDAMNTSSAPPENPIDAADAPLPPAPSPDDPSERVEIEATASPPRKDPTLRRKRAVQRAKDRELYLEEIDAILAKFNKPGDAAQPPSPRELDRDTVDAPSQPPRPEAPLRDTPSDSLFLSPLDADADKELMSEAASPEDLDPSESGIPGATSEEGTFIEDALRQSLTEDAGLAPPKDTSPPEPMADDERGGMHVTPAKAGVQNQTQLLGEMDSRLRGNDNVETVAAPSMGDGDTRSEQSQPDIAQDQAAAASDAAVDSSEGMDRISRLLAEEVEELDLDDLLEVEPSPFEQLSEPPQAHSLTPPGQSAAFSIGRGDQETAVVRPSDIVTSIIDEDEDEDEDLGIEIKNGEFEIYENGDVPSTPSVMPDPPPTDSELLLENMAITDALDEIFSDLDDDGETSSQVLSNLPETLPEDAVPPGLVRERPRQFEKKQFEKSPNPIYEASGPPPSRAGIPVPPVQDAKSDPEEKHDKKKGFFKKLFR